MILPIAIERIADLLSKNTAGSGSLLIAIPTAPLEPEPCLCRILQLARRMQNGARWRVVDAGAQPDVVVFKFKRDGERALAGGEA